jgi:hypothetical protein
VISVNVHLSKGGRTSERAFPKPYYLTHLSFYR